MKRLIVMLAVCGLTGGIALLAAETLQLSETPSAVQNAVKAKRASATVASVKSEEKDGQTIYKVEFKDAQANPALWVAKDGSIVKENERGVFGLFESKSLALSDLPTAVQATTKSAL